MLRCNCAWHAGSRTDWRAEIMDTFCNRTFLRRIAIALAAACLAACGADTERYAIGGTVSGLSGAGLVLANADSGNLAVSASGPFSFTPGLPSGASYNISVKSQPDGQSCAVTHGTGTVGTAAVTDVAVTCVAAAPMALLSATPSNGSPGVPRTVAPALMFSAALSSTVNSTGITLRSAAGEHPLTTGVSGSALTVTPRRKLLPLTAYTLTVGTTVRGSAGEQLPAAVTTTFTTADAAWQPAGLLSPDTPDQTFDPRVAMNAKGDMIAVWRQHDGSRMRLMSRLYTVGTGWGSIFTIDDTVGVAPTKGIALDAMGNAFAVWETSESYNCGDESTCHRTRLWTSRFTPQDGWGDPRLMAYASDSSTTEPQIAMNSGGDAVLVWAEDDGSGGNIWARRYSVDDGWRNAVKIQTQSGRALAPQVAMDESGNAMAIWTQRNGPANATSYEIFANRYSSGSWGTAVGIKSDHTQLDLQPRLAMNERGEAAAVWLQSDGQGFNLWFNAFTTSHGWGTAELVADYAEYATNPAVTIDALGNSLLVWEELYHEGLVFRMNVWSNRRAANSSWGVATRLVNTARADPAQLVMDESGNAVAAWSQQEAGARSSLWSSRYIPNVGWSVPALLETDDAGDAMLTGLELSRSGDVTVVWHQFDGIAGSGGRQHAYYRRLE